MAFIYVLFESRNNYAGRDDLRGLSTAISEKNCRMVVLGTISSYWRHILGGSPMLNKISIILFPGHKYRNLPWTQYRAWSILGWNSTTVLSRSSLPLDPTMFKVYQVLLQNVETGFNWRIRSKIFNIRYSRYRICLGDLPATSVRTRRRIENAVCMLYIRNHVGN